MRPTDFSRPDGFVDHDAADTRLRRRIERALLEVFERHGFAEVTVPTIEYLELYDPARIGSELYHSLIPARLSESAAFALPDDADEGVLVDYDAVLRPDLTAPVARMFVSGVLERGALPYLPARVAYAGQVFRNLDPDGQRRKEFRQVGVELVGNGSDLADREILSLTCDALRAVDVRGWEMRLGHARLIELILCALGLNAPQRLTVRRGLDRVTRARLAALASDEAFARQLRPFIAELLRARDARAATLPDEPPCPPELLDPARLDAAGWRARLPELLEDEQRRVWTRAGLDDEQIERVLPLANASGDPEAFFRAMAPYRLDEEIGRTLDGEIANLITHLEAREGCSVRVTPAATRGIRYYTGMSFDVHATAGDALGAALCGGGRYDKLYEWLYRRAAQTAARRGGAPLPPVPGVERLFAAVGLAFGLEPLTAAARAGGQGAGARLDVFVAVARADLAERGDALARRLRAEGPRVRLHLPRRDAPMSLEDQLAHARHEGARLAVIVSSREGAVTTLDLRTDARGDLDCEDLPAYISRRLSTSEG
jgi:histidyl-tRNA synthetase